MGSCLNLKKITKQMCEKMRSWGVLVTIAMGFLFGLVFAGIGGISAGLQASDTFQKLQINKIEENRIVLESLTFNISDEITMVKNSLSFIAQNNNNKIVVNIDPAIPEYLIGDKLRLSQILMNLVSNALKFTKNGTVTIFADLDRTEGTMNFIKFKVTDNGIGIAKEDQDKIFDKFVIITCGHSCIHVVHNL